MKADQPVPSGTGAAGAKERERSGERVLRIHTFDEQRAFDGGRAA